VQSQEFSGVDKFDSQLTSLTQGVVGVLRRKFELDDCASVMRYAEIWVDP
jgi:hypothetical protein